MSARSRQLVVSAVGMALGFGAAFGIGKATEGGDSHDSRTGETLQAVEVNSAKPAVPQLAPAGELPGLRPKGASTESSAAPAPAPAPAPTLAPAPAPAPEPAPAPTPAPAPEPPPEEGGP